MITEGTKRPSSFWRSKTGIALCTFLAIAASEAAADAA